MAITPYLTTYMDLFVGRHDDYAIQLSTGRYRRAKKPLTKEDIYNHLRGTDTYGTYIMDASGHCRFAVIDADTDDGLDRLWQIQEQLATHGIVSYVERSRRGGHLWVFFSQPALASQVRAWLLPYCPSDMEFYPKQNEGIGYGSLIRLPLGVHRKSGQRYPFVERRAVADLVPLTVTDDQRAAWFALIQRMEVPEPVLLLDHPTRSQAQKPLLSSSQHCQSETDGISPIRQWNANQDHVQVIGRYVELSARKYNNYVGKCPLGDHHTAGEDSQASFKVYAPNSPGGYCWHCYTWEKGGSLFDFLRYYYHLSTQEMWERIRADTI